MARRALITGITGQDGSYLAELLLEKGYAVHGMVRRASTEKFDRIEHIRDRLTLHQGDLLDQSSLVDTLRASEPDEIYNLAAMSFVAVSWLQPTLTAEFTGTGVTRMLEAMREVCPEARFYQASSSEMFGKVREVPQSETTPFYPRSPYGVAKAYGHFITVNYRESYGLHTTSGILFNHECVASNTPLIVRRGKIASVTTPAELVPLLDSVRSVQTFAPGPVVEVWDGEDWTPITAVTATRRRDDPDHELRSIETSGSVVAVTAHHHMLDSDLQLVLARDVEAGDRVALCHALPSTGESVSIAAEAVDLLGRLTGGALDRATTADPVLAQNLIWLCALRGHEVSLHVERRSGEVRYCFSVGIALPVAAGAQPLGEDPALVRLAVVAGQAVDDDWVFDIETASGMFCAGVGRIRVHNSPRRGLEFVTRKITWHAAAIKHGLRDTLMLGNLDARRDWGYAKDYVEAMWLMLQQDIAEDFVIATSQQHSVRDCVEVAFDEAGLGDWERYVELDSSLVRPAEVDHLVGDYGKAERVLGWKPRTHFEELIRLMTRADLELMASGSVR
jgi:GDP-D-mannose dehydratase